MPLLVALMNRSMSLEELENNLKVVEDLKLRKTWVTVERNHKVARLSLNKCAWNDATGHLTRLRHITILPVYKLVKVQISKF
uniref:Uncharacterized protein n=1 Tax=Helianthus annuus TaxID=4232 RepID=A0A251RTD1_HELAN